MSGRPDGAGHTGETVRTAGDDFLVVGLGASAGGIGALKEFFARVAPDSGLAYVVILHLSPEHESHLAEVLQTVTPLPVTQVTGTVKVEPDHVYVIPQDRNLTISDGALSISPVAGYEERRAPVDIFLRTLAESHDSRAVGVILSGTGANGSMGLKRVKEYGGLVIAQDPREAEYDDMPRHALMTGLVDYAMPVAEMPARIAEYAERLRRSPVPARSPERETGTDEQALRDVLAQLRVRTGHDFANYKRATLLRRVGRRMNVHGLATLADYARFLREHPDEPAALLRDLLISVTNFFRDRAAFEALEQKVVPALFEGKGEGDFVRAWVAGCATGEEAYSIAMLLAERVAGGTEAPTVQVFASDLDAQAIATAREGFYTLNDVADVPPERLRRFFVKDGGGYRVRTELREMVLFAHHNVIKDPPFSHIDLVSCRNLLIYLNRAAQQRVMEVVHFALKRGGYLFLGTSETTDGASNLFVAADRDAHIYQARAASPRTAFPVPEPAPTTPATLRQSFRPAEEQPPSRRASYGDLHQRLLEQYAPPSVVVNEHYDVLHLSERAGRYMQLAGGEPTNNLLLLARPDLRLDLRTALYQAARERTNVEARGLSVRVDEHTETVNLIVRPVLDEGDTARDFFLVLFEQAGEADGDGRPASAPAEAATPVEPPARGLEEELARVKSQLRVTVEQYETSAEELRASNEELQAMNEELRSAAEELETSKEELQSINEELTTVNQELKVKIEELSHANNDFQNLINSTQIATVFLDRSLRVKLFTPPASHLFNLLPVDTGRPLADITHNFAYDGLTADAERVNATLQAQEREVETTDGRVFLMRLLPYRTADDRIDGVVLTFLDITERRRAEDRLRESEEQFRRAIEDAPIPVIMHAEDGQVLQLSRTWTELTGYGREDVPTFDAWLTRAYGEGAEAVREHMHELFNGRRGSLNVDFPVRARGGEVRHWSFSASAPGVLLDGRRFIVGMALDITEHERAEQELRESEERFRAMFEQANVGIVQVTLDGRMQMPNEGFCQIIGYTEEEARGLRVRDVTHPDDYGREEELTRQLLGGDIPGYSIRKRYVRKDGRIVWGQMTATVVRSPAHDPAYLLAIVEDITERTQAEEALRLGEERLRSIVEGVTDYAIITQDAEGRVETWNPGAERMFGYTADEMIGRSVEVLFTPEDRAAGAHLEEMRTARRTGRSSDERWHLRKDGARFYASGVMSPSGDMTPTGYVKIARDLTAEKQAEDDLRRAYDELEERVRERTVELAEANVSLQAEVGERAAAEEQIKELLRQLVSIQEEERRRIARDLHDHLGQQMTALRLSLESLRETCDGPAREKLEQTQALAARLDSDVDFLAWELRPAALDHLGLPTALRNFLKEFSSHFQIKGRFHTRGLGRKRLAPETEINLYRIAQEALNNIYKHARATSVDVLLELRGDEVVLIVEDDGRGFDQVEAAAAGVGDRGLGLVGMRERAAIVGGTVEIETAPGEGTTVFARVPARPAERRARRKGGKKRE